MCDSINYADTYATYCPEDNKLRLYVGRVPREDYEALRKQGWKSTPKQDCDFVATWSPGREDMAIDMVDCPDIQDEDQSPEERAADRAERFGGYRDKRLGEAVGHADNFDAGPAVHGYQSQAKADRAARRHDRQRVRAVSQWEKAEYWQRRTAGVISNALYKSSAKVRRGRVLKIEKQLRDTEKTRAEAVEAWKLWRMVTEKAGADVPIVEHEDPMRLGVDDSTTEAGKFVYNLASNRTYAGWRYYQHPRQPEKVSSLYSLLTDSADPITPKEAAELWLGSDPDTEPCTDPRCGNRRWFNHLTLRLEYENAMLAAEGGSMTDQALEPGGKIGGYLIHGVNKSPATGRPVSIKVYAEHPWKTGDDGGPLWCLQSVNIERLGAEGYTPPTAEGLAEVKETRAKLRKAKQKSNAGAPKLINPDEATAAGLQAIINAGIGEYSRKEPAEVAEITQKQYIANSKGTYAKLGVYCLLASGDLVSVDYCNIRGVTPICKVRIWPGSFDRPQRVIVLTDKPRKPLPLDLIKVEEEETAQA